MIPRIDTSVSALSALEPDWNRRLMRRAACPGVQLLDIAIGIRLVARAALRVTENRVQVMAGCQPGSAGGDPAQVGDPFDPGQCRKQMPVADASVDSSPWDTHCGTSCLHARFRKSDSATGRHFAAGDHSPSETGGPRVGRMLPVGGPTLVPPVHAADQSARLMRTSGIRSKLRGAGRYTRTAVGRAASSRSVVRPLDLFSAYRARRLVQGRWRPDETCCSHHDPADRASSGLRLPPAYVVMAAGAVDRATRENSSAMSLCEPQRARSGRVRPGTVRCGRLPAKPASHRRRSSEPSGRPVVHHAVVPEDRRLRRCILTRPPGCQADQNNPGSRMKLIASPSVSAIGRQVNTRGGSRTGGHVFDKAPAGFRDRRCPPGGEPVIVPGARPARHGPRHTCGASAMSWQRSWRTAGSSDAGASA